MSKHHPHRKDAWPVWKIALIAIFAAVVGAGLLWFSLHISTPESKPVATAPASPGDPTKTPTPPAMHIVLLFCLLAWATAAVFTGLLVYKLYMRIPAWRRRQLFGRSKG